MVLPHRRRGDVLDLPRRHDRPPLGAGDEGKTAARRLKCRKRSGGGLEQWSVEGRLTSGFWRDSRKFSASAQPARVVELEVALQDFLIELENLGGLFESGPVERLQPPALWTRFRLHVGIESFNKPLQLGFHRGNASEERRLPRRRGGGCGAFPETQ